MKSSVIQILMIWLISLNISAQTFSTIKSPKTGDLVNLSKAVVSTQIISLDIDSLRLLRNEIYARHGYQFNSYDLQQYFSSFKWYHPVSYNNIAEKALTYIDKLNIDLISSLENTKKAQRSKEFHAFTKNIDFVKLPFEYTCDSINTLYSEYRERLNSFVPDGSQIVGKLYDTGEKTAIIYFFIGDFFYSYIYIYNNVGQIISRIPMLDSCGFDEGYISQTEGTITVDYKLIIKHTLITWDAENENSVKDSVVNVNEIMVL